MRQFTATREGILQLLKQALEENQPKEIIERLQWFLHFTEYGSVSGTCRRFRIARSTFYRWQRRFDPNDLSTLADLPPSQGTAIFQGVPAFCRVQQSLAHTVAMAKETSAPSSHTCPFCRFWSWIQPLWKRCGRFTVLLSIFLNLAILFFMLLPGGASASSWSPTLLVNTESFQIIDDSGSTNIELRFGDSTNEILRWDATNARFQFTDDVHTEGNLTSSGTLTIQGATVLKSTLKLNGVAYTFPTSDGSASGKVLKTDGSGKLSWSADTGASSGVSQSEADARYVNVSGDTMTGALSIKKTSGTATGNTLVVDTKGLVYDATNKRVGIGDTTPSNELEVRGTVSGSSLHAHSLLTSSGNVLAAGNITVNSDNGAADAVLTFGNDAAAETLRFNDTTNGFVFSDDVEVQGTLSGANLTVMSGAISYILGNVGIGTISPNTNLVIAKTATTGYTIPDAYINLGDAEFGVNSTRLITLGYTGGTNPPAYMGFVENPVLAGNTKGALVFGTRNVTTDTLPTERMRIDEAGNVGIGDTTPGNTLEVRGTASGSSLHAHSLLTSSGNVLAAGNITVNSDNGAADAVLTFGNDAAAETLRFNDTTNGFVFSDDVEVQGTLSGANLTVMAGADSYLMGNVGIGTTAPTTKLEVIGTMSGKALAIHTNQTSKTGALLLNQDGNGTGMLLDSEATNAPGMAISMPTSNAVNNPHLLFGYNNTFDTKLYRSAANTLTPSGHFVPSAHNTFNLGTTSVRWANVYSGPGSFHVGVEGNEARIGFNEEFSELEFDSDGDHTADVIVDKQGRMGIGARPSTDTLEVEGSAAKSSPGGWRGRSDIRIKKDVKTIENSLDVINALRPVQYRFKPEYLAEHPLIKDNIYYNYVAQEFKNVFPDSVFEDAAGYLQIDSYAVNPYLVGSVQELSAKVKALEGRMVSAEGAGSVLTISGGTINITAGYHLVAMQDGKKNDVLAYIRGGVLGQVLVLQPKDKQKITLRKSGHLLLEEDFQMHNPGDIIVLLKIDDSRWVELTRSKSNDSQLVKIFSGWEEGAFETVDEGSIDPSIQ